MKLKTNIQAYNFLELIAISGEFPVTNIDRLAGGSEYKKKMIYHLKKSGLIRKYSKDKTHSYKLTVAGKKLLLENNYVRLAFFLTGDIETNLHKSELFRRLRLHKIAQTHLIMQKAGIHIFRDIKTPVFSSEFSIVSSERHSYSEIITPAFYDSKEIKTLLGEKSTKIMSSRLVGVLLTSKDIFAVYNTGDSLMKWGHKIEQRTKMMFCLYFSKTNFDYAGHNIKSIMIGSDMDMAVKIFESDGCGKQCLLNIDDIYDGMYFIPNDENGDMLFNILSNPKIQNEVHNLLMENLTLASCNDLSRTF